MITAIRVPARRNRGNPASFDVVTSFGGSGGTTPDAVPGYTGSFDPPDASL
jgi:hypothetical protein